MREININKIVPIVKKLCIDASIYIGDDVVEKLKEFQEKEESPIAKEIISIIFENQKLAVEKKMPLCQDTGSMRVFGRDTKKVTCENPWLMIR
jgi:fumarate hydratase subunit alpha